MTAYEQYQKEKYGTILTDSEPEEEYSDGREERWLETEHEKQLEI